jgi:hypothetical protein
MTDDLSLRSDTALMPPLSSDPYSDSIPRDSHQTEYERLRQRQVEAINNFDFKEAADLQAQMDAATLRSSEDKIGTFRESFVAALDEAARRHFTARAKIIRSFHNEEIRERKKFDDSFTQLQADHVQKLNELQERLTAEYETRMSKAIPNYDVLVDQAKKAAQQYGSFEQAQTFQDTADRLKTEEQKTRSETFQKYYNQRMNALFESQQTDLVNYGLRITPIIEKLEKRRTDALKDQTNRFRRDLSQEYTKMSQRITSRYDPRKRPAPLDPKQIPEYLNALEEEYRTALARYGLKEEESVKGSMLVSSSRAQSSRMQSRMQSREGEWNAQQKVPRSPSRGPRSSLAQSPSRASRANQ